MDHERSSSDHHHPRVINLRYRGYTIRFSWSPQHPLNQIGPVLDPEDRTVTYSRANLKVKLMVLITWAVIN